MNDIKVNSQVGPDDMLNAMNQEQQLFDPQNFARKLHDFRSERGLTQTEVAKAIGVYKRSISLWENTMGKPSLESVIALSKFFGVSTDYLLFENVPREGVEAINDFELYGYFRKTEALTKELRDALKKVLDAVVFKEKVKEIPESDFPKEQDQRKQTAAPLRKVAGKR